MWSALHPIILPALLLNFVPDSSKNTYLGLLTFLGLLIAVVIQPLSGAASDRWVSRFGRRRPLIVVGTLLDFLFLLVLASSVSLGWLFVGYAGLQFSSNIAQGPLQGLLRDRVPDQQLGKASAVKILLDTLGLILAAVLAGRLLTQETHNVTAIILVIVGVLAVSAAVTTFFTPEEPMQSSRRTGWRGLSEEFRIDFGHDPDYWHLVAERALFLLGIYGLQIFLQYYLRDVFRVPNPPRQTGDLLAAITASVVVLVLAGGWLTDRLGPKGILYVASGIVAAGMLLMVPARDVRTFTPLALAVGAGIGLFLASNWALANRLSPRAEAGKFLGLTNLATAGAAALARLQGPAIDILNSARPSAWIGYKGLFIFGAVCILLSTVFLSRIRVCS